MEQKVRKQILLLGMVTAALHVDALKHSLMEKQVEGIALRRQTYPQRAKKGRRKLNY